jgi:hypothetical protein
MITPSKECEWQYTQKNKKSRSHRIKLGEWRKARLNLKWEFILAKNFNNLRLYLKVRVWLMISKIKI